MQRALFLIGLAALVVGGCDRGPKPDPAAIARASEAEAARRRARIDRQLAVHRYQQARDMARSSDSDAAYVEERITAETQRRKTLITGMIAEKRYDDAEAALLKARSALPMSGSAPLFADLEATLVETRTADAQPKAPHWTAAYKDVAPRHLLEELGETGWQKLVTDVGAYLALEKEDAEARKLVVDAGVSLTLLRAAIRAGRHVPLPERGRMVVNVPLQTPGGKTNYYLAIPRDPKRGERYPLWVELHGGGGGGPHMAQGMNHVFDMEPEFGKFVQVMPIAIAGLGWGPSDAGTGQIRALLADVRKRIAIDPERVYLSGFSMGGFGCWHYALHDPTPIAAIVPVAARVMSYKLPLMPNLMHIGVWAVHQTGDPIVPVAGARLAAKALQALGHPRHTYKEYPGEQHGGEPPEDGFKKMNWLFNQRRNPRPERVVARCPRPRPERRYHVLITNYDPKREVKTVRIRVPSGSENQRWFAKPAALTVALRRNEFHVTTDGVTRFELLLSPLMVNFDKPIIVREGEKVLFLRKISVDPGQVLELARAYPDMDYAARIVVSWPAR